MKKRHVLLPFAIAMMLVTLGFSTVPQEEQTLACLACSGRKVIEKAPNEPFTVTVSFKNTGDSEGSWSVNVAFEGQSWTWSGTPQNLTLERCHKKTLTWNGSVSGDAPLYSVSRLIVYYNDSFEALDWWIHVVEGAELEITSSTVK